jgi:hypothetical protein
MTPVRIGLAGYGRGGRFFHAPLIGLAPECTLAGVLTRSPQRRAELADDFPGLPAAGRLAELAAAGIDAVVISTPLDTHEALAGMKASPPGTVLQHEAAGLPLAAGEKTARSTVDATPCIRSATRPTRNARPSRGPHGSARRLRPARPAGRNIRSMTMTGTHTDHLTVSRCRGSPGAARRRARRSSSPATPW